jgi:hypothetical protein
MGDKMPGMDLTENLTLYRLDGLKSVVTKKLDTYFTIC